MCQATTTMTTMQMMSSPPTTGILRGSTTSKPQGIMRSSSMPTDDCSTTSPKKLKKSSSFMKRCKKALRRVSSSSSLDSGKISKTSRKQMSESTTSTFVSDDEFVEEYMCLSTTLPTDTFSTLSLRPQVPDRATKEHVRKSSDTPKVSFGQNVTLVEMPKYKELSDLKADLWYTNDEMRKMKLESLLKKK